jgi:GNAT superfamily N-acetyltransferase
LKDAKSGEFSVRRARTVDIEAVLAILDEAAHWLASRGIQQWLSPFPRVVVERDFESHTVWLASHDGYPIATASTLRRDPMFWGDLTDNAWYLHRLAIRRNWAGAGSQILERIEGQARMSGVGYMRLDCGAGLQTYYENAGYGLRSSLSLVNATSAPRRSQWFCYEKILTTPP